MERGSKVTADLNSDHCSEQYFDENKSCPSCKEEIERLKQENKRLKDRQYFDENNLQREKDEEIERLKQENKQLNEELAKVRETVSRGCYSCEPEAPSNMDTADCFPDEATGAMKGSSVMKKTRNDSSQVADIISPGRKRQSPDRMGSERMDCDETHSRAASKTASKPSTSVTASAPKREGADLRGAAGGRDDGAVGENSLSELRKVPRKLMGALQFSNSHTILVDVNLYAKGTIVARNGLALWDAYSVRMPYMEQNKLQGESRWEKIKTSLRNLEKPWTGSLTAKDVEKNIKRYNPKYKDEWSFDALQKFFEVIDGDEGKSLTRTLKRMAGLALELPEVCPKGIPLLRTGKSHSITLSQKQIACLLANAFFCTFPYRNATNPQAEYANYPTINFHSLFGRSERKMQKFRAIFHYFRVVTGAGKKEWKVPEGLVTFTREYISESSIPSWKRCSEHLTNLNIFSEGTIEGSGQDKLQVDFACSLVGGGVLASGLVQEEILFLVHPELIVARLFTEKLGDTECLRITGAQQYSEYYGYKDEFTWVKHHEDNTERDEWLRRKRQIVAIDALDFKNPKDQFHLKKVDRELNKAYCGFTGDSETHCCYPTIATGNWGCGAFGGDVRLKALIQMMAAAVAKRDMAYFTFGDRGLKQELEEMHHFLTQRNITVGRLYRTLEHFCYALNTGNQRASDLYNYIRTAVKDTTSLI